MIAGPTGQHIYQIPYSIKVATSPPANASAPVYKAPVTITSPANTSVPVYTSPPSTGTITTASASIPLEYILIGAIALIVIIAAVILI